MEKLKVVVVDDEEAARDVLSNLLHRSKVPLDILALCENLADGVAAIREHQPDVVFLDVQMPDYAGYEIADFFDEIDFEIIFVTAYDQYAIKAFELSAVDYLVKPIERTRLTEALDKLQNRMEQKAAALNYRVLLESVREKELGKIVISELKDGQMVRHLLNLKDIIAIEAQGAYTQLHLQNAPTLLVSRNLKHFEQRLPMDDPFFRSHRSWILNLDHVQSYNLRHGIVTLSAGVEAKVSKNRQEALSAQARA